MRSGGPPQCKDWSGPSLSSALPLRVAACGRALPVATGKYPVGHLVEGYVQTRSGQCEAACAKSLSVVSKVRSCLMHSCASRASIVPS